MTDPIFLDWFKAVFPNPMLNLPYPAVIENGVTYVFTMMLELDELREMVKKHVPPVPIVPVVAIDCPMPSDPPRLGWVGLSDKDLHLYRGSMKLDGFAPPMESFNQTIAAMTKLYEEKKKEAP